MSQRQIAIKSQPLEPIDAGGLFSMSNGADLEQGRHAGPDLRSAYEEIGKLLEIAEAAVLGVGIHWLPPTARVCRIRRLYTGNLSEFIRTGLVGVQTHFLESYIEDLENDAPGKDGKSKNDYLFISGPTFFERYALVVLVVLLLMIGAALFGETLLQDSTVSSKIWIVAGILGIGGFVGTSMCSESMRHRSFSALLESEVCRRRGLDQPNMTKLPLAAMKPGSVGE